MIRRIPPRDYLTFTELMERWQRNGNDIRFAIISGALKPCIQLNGECSYLEWEQTHEGFFAHQLTDGNTGQYMTGQPLGWHYLQDPRQTGPFDCLFRFAASIRDPIKLDWEAMTDWFSLGSGMTLEQVEREAVFMQHEIERYEKHYPTLGCSTQPEIAEKLLGTTERKTLLTIIAALAKEAKINIEPPGKAALSIEALTDKMGVHVSKRAIEDHLKKIPDALEVRMK
ncbi:MAG: hypothetical protein Q7K57_42035 [Burkholderiaceae bacterium]|nr:hypothetical protein [Burkholderiaceae bacterium]